MCNDYNINGDMASCGDPNSGKNDNDQTVPIAAFVVGVTIVGVCVCFVIVCMNRFCERIKQACCGGRPSDPEAANEVQPNSAEETVSCPPKDPPSYDVAIRELPTYQEVIAVGNV